MKKRLSVLFAGLLCITCILISGCDDAQQTPYVPYPYNDTTPPIYKEPAVQPTNPQVYTEPAIQPTNPPIYTQPTTEPTMQPTTPPVQEVKLFDLPVYSDKNALSLAVSHLSYSSEEVDSAGWKHTDCYIVCGSTTECWLRYELNEKYSTLVGNLYFRNDNSGAGWLEFYDGETFIASTAKIDKSVTPSTEFKIDVSGVSYLTVHLCSTRAGMWMIADDISLIP